jgi:hypothetical protein
MRRKNRMMNTRANIVALAGGLSSLIGRKEVSKISAGGVGIARLGKFVSILGGDMFKGLWEITSVSNTMGAARGEIDCENICSKAGD